MSLKPTYSSVKTVTKALAARAEFAPLLADDSAPFADSKGRVEKFSAFTVKVVEALNAKKVNPVRASRVLIREIAAELSGITLETLPDPVVEGEQEPAAERLNPFVYTLLLGAVSLEADMEMSSKILALTEGVLNDNEAASDSKILVHTLLTCAAEYAGLEPTLKGLNTAIKAVLEDYTQRYS